MPRKSSSTPKRRRRRPTPKKAQAATAADLVRRGFAVGGGSYSGGGSYGAPAVPSMNIQPLLDALKTTVESLRGKAAAPTKTTTSTSTSTPDVFPTRPEDEPGPLPGSSGSGTAPTPAPAFTPATTWFGGEAHGAYADGETSVRWRKRIRFSDDFNPTFASGGESTTTVEFPDDDAPPALPPPPPPVVTPPAGVMQEQPIVDSAEGPWMGDTTALGGAGEPNSVSDIGNVSVVLFEPGIPGASVPRHRRPSPDITADILANRAGPIRHEPLLLEDGANYDVQDEPPLAIPRGPLLLTMPTPENMNLSNLEKLLGVGPEHERQKRTRSDIAALDVIRRHPTLKVDRDLLISATERMANALQSEDAGDNKKRPSEARDQFGQESAGTLFPRGFFPQILDLEAERQADPTDYMIRWEDT